MIVGSGVESSTCRWYLTHGTEWDHLEWVQMEKRRGPKSKSWGTPACGCQGDEERAKETEQEWTGGRRWNTREQRLCCWEQNIFQGVYFKWLFIKFWVGTCNLGVITSGDVIQGNWLGGGNNRYAVSVTEHCPVPQPACPWEPLLLGVRVAWAEE